MLWAPLHALGLLALAGTLGCREPRAAERSAEAATAPARYDMSGPPAWRATLPAELHEVSGLAVTRDGRLFAHGDEVGTVFELEPRSGRVLRSFSLAPTGSEPDLGKKPKDGEVAGDFEDIAVVGDRFYLVTSNGVLVEFGEGADGDRVPYAAHPTALDGICEVEGLAHDADANELLLLCKQMRRKAERDRVAIYAWSLADRRLGETPRLVVPTAALAGMTGSEEFNGSALAFMPGGSLLLIAGPQRLFAEIAADGSPVRAGALDGAAHRQPEGIALLPDGTLLVSSEGGKGEATLGGYPPR